MKNCFQEFKRLSKQQYEEPFWVSYDYGYNWQRKKLFSLNCVIVICLKALVVFTVKFVLLLTFFLAKIANIHELICFDRHK